MPKKPIKIGFKAWVRADAVSGYISEIDIIIHRKGPGELEYGLGGNLGCSFLYPIHVWYTTSGLTITFISRTINLNTSHQTKMRARHDPFYVQT